MKLRFIIAGVLASAVTIYLIVTLVAVLSIKSSLGS